MLASDTDRDTVTGLLSEAFAEDRLTEREHGERVRAAYAARTWADLDLLTADLPATGGDARARPAAGFGGLDRCLLCVLLCLCPPAGIAWLLISRRRSPADASGARAPTTARAGDMALRSGDPHAEDR